MSLQIACSMFNNSCHALCMYSTVYYECRAGSGLVPGPPRPHHPPSCFPHYPSPSRPCPGCVFFGKCIFPSGPLLNKIGQFTFYRNIMLRRQYKSLAEDPPPNQNHIVFEFALILIMIRFAPMLAQDVFIQTQHAQRMASSI